MTYLLSDLCRESENNDSQIAAPIAGSYDINQSLSVVAGVAEEPGREVSPDLQQKIDDLNWGSVTSPVFGSSETGRYV